MPQMHNLEKGVRPCFAANIDSAGGVNIVPIHDRTACLFSTGYPAIRDKVPFHIWLLAYKYDPYPRRGSFNISKSLRREYPAIVQTPDTAPHPFTRRVTRDNQRYDTIFRKMSSSDTSIMLVTIQWNLLRLGWTRSAESSTLPPIDSFLREAMGRHTASAATGRHTASAAAAAPVVRASLSASWLMPCASVIPSVCCCWCSSACSWEMDGTKT